MKATEMWTKIWNSPVICVLINKFVHIATGCRRQRSKNVVKRKKKKPVKLRKIKSKAKFRPTSECPVAISKLCPYF